MRALLLPVLCAALLASCATWGGAVSSPATLAQLEQAERAFAEGDLRAARGALDAAFALQPRGAGLERARRLDGQLGARELEPFEPAFHELALALEGRDQELATRVLNAIELRGPRGVAAQRAAAFRNIVDGRATTGALELRLEAEPTRDEGEFRVLLCARNELWSELRLHCPGSALDFTALGVNEAGIESRTKRRVLTDALEDLELPQGKLVRVPLGTFYVPSRGLLAARGGWSLTTLGGGIVRDGRELPANSFVVRGCEVLRVDPRLPAGEVEPAEFARYVERGAPSLAALLERSARLAPARREEALDLATPALSAYLPEELERVAPALRWLTALDEPPPDGESWRAWLGERVRRRSTPARPALDMPGSAAQALPPTGERP